MAMSRSSSKLLPKIIQVIDELGNRGGSPLTHIIENLRSNNDRYRIRGKNLTAKIQSALKHGIDNGTLTYRAGKYKVNDRKGSENLDPDPDPEEKICNCGRCSGWGTSRKSAWRKAGLRKNSFKKKEGGRKSSWKRSNWSRSGWRTPKARHRSESPDEKEERRSCDCRQCTTESNDKHHEQSSDVEESTPRGEAEQLSESPSKGKGKDRKRKSGDAEGEYEKPNRSSSKNSRGSRVSRVSRKSKVQKANEQLNEKDEKQKDKKDRKNVSRKQSRTSKINPRSRRPTPGQDENQDRMETRDPNSYDEEEEHNTRSYVS